MILRLNPPDRASGEERRRFNATAGARWAAYHQRKRDTAMRLRTQLAWDAW